MAADKNIISSKEMLIRTVNALLAEPQISIPLLTLFYHQLLSHLPCCSTGAQCTLVLLGIDLQKAVSARNRYHEVLKQILKQLIDPQEFPSTLDPETLNANMEVLRLRVEECLQIKL